MASPISKSPRRGRSPSPRSPQYKFTIFPPDVYAPITLSYMPSTDKSYKFCSFLKDKFETHFGMRCSLPTSAGTAYIGDFDEFERLFLIDAEYIVVVVTQKSVTALRKFYPRLLVFVTVRPEWVNRFILVFVGDVALDPSIDLSVLIHQPIIFKESDWEADLETWKALHKLLKVSEGEESGIYRYTSLSGVCESPGQHTVSFHTTFLNTVEWTPHKEDKPSPTRRGEVLSVIQRTVVETEVQEVRTRRRSSSRNSDTDSATPGTLSPLPGASRKLAPAPSDGSDLHIVSPSVEKPSIVEEMATGRRKFGGEPDVGTSKPVVREASPMSNSERKPTPKVVIQRPNDTSKPDVVEAPLSPSNERKPMPKVVIQRLNDTSKPDVEVPLSPSNDRRPTPKVVIQRPNDTSKPDVVEAPLSPSNERRPTPKVVIQRPNDNGTTSKSATPAAEKGAAAPKVQIVRETPKSNVESQRNSGENARPSSLFGAAKLGETEKTKEKKDSWKFASEVRTKKTRDKPEEQKRKAEDGGPMALEEPVTASKGRTFRSTPQTKPKQEPAPENQSEITTQRTSPEDNLNESQEIITPERTTRQRSAPSADNGKLEQEIPPERTTGQRGAPAADNGKLERVITPRSAMERTGQDVMAENGGKNVKEVIENNNKDKEAPGNKGDKESAQDSVQTSGYSSLDSSISTRSMGQIPTTPVSIKVSPFEGESSTDVSYVTAPETLSLPAPQQAVLSTDGTGEKPVETPETSDMASLPSETPDKQEVEAFQLPKESDETKETSSRGKSDESLPGPHQPGQVVERKFEEEGRTVNVKVSSEAATHPFTGAPVISKAIEIDVEGDDDETFFFSTEFDDMLAAAPPPPLNVSEDNESVVRLRRNLRLLETAFGGQEEETAAAVTRRKRGLSGGEVERPRSSSSITVSSDVDEAPSRYSTTITVSKSPDTSLKGKSASMTSLNPDFNIFTVPRAAHSVENINTEARETFRAPEAFIVTTQMPDMSCARPRSLAAIPATPDSPPKFTFEVGSPRTPHGDLLHVTSTKELFTHTVGVVEVSREPEIEVATIQEPRVLTGLEVSLPENKDSPVTSIVEFLASRVETASPQRTATMQFQVGEPLASSHGAEEAGQGSPRARQTFVIPENPVDEEITARTTASLNASLPSAADKEAVGDLGDARSRESIPDRATTEEGIVRPGPIGAAGDENLELRQCQEHGKKHEEDEITALTSASLNAAPQSATDKGAVGSLENVGSGTEKRDSRVTSPDERLSKTSSEKVAGAEKPESGKVILTARRSGKDSANPGKFILTARKADQDSANPGKVVLTARKADQDSANPGKVVLTPRKADSAGPGKVILTVKRTNPDSKTSGRPALIDEKNIRPLGASAEEIIVPEDTKRQRTTPWETPPAERNTGRTREEANHEAPVVASKYARQANEDHMGKMEGRTSAVPKEVNGSSIPMLKIQPATPIDSLATPLGPTSVSGHSPSNPSKDDVRTNESPPSLVDERAYLNVSPPRLPTVAVAPSQKLPSLPSVGARKVGSVPGVSRSSDGSYHRTDSRERCLIDDLSYASLTSEEDQLRIMRRDESLEEPVFDDDKEEKRVWMLTGLALRLPRSLMSAGTGMLTSSWLMASNAGITVGRLVWPGGVNSTDKPNRPFRILILATATALSPFYRQLSLSFFEMLSTFLWPSVEGLVESGVVSFPVAEISADSSALVTETLPQLTTLSIVSPSQFGRSSPTELLMPANFIFWVTSPPR